MVQFDEEKQDERVRALHRKEEEELIASLSRRHGVPYLDLSTHPINIDALRIIKEADARAAKIAVFDAIDKKIDVAVLSPENEKTVGLIGDLKRRSYVPRSLWSRIRVLRKCGADTKIFRIHWKPSPAPSTFQTKKLLK